MTHDKELIKESKLTAATTANYGVAIGGQIYRAATINYLKHPVFNKMYELYKETGKQSYKRSLKLQRILNKIN